jgi:uncharacterized protein GlcG (DUF336 family)
LPPTSRLTLGHANALIAATLEAADGFGLQPLTVAVLDADGALLALQRQDTASRLRPDIAIGKASGALDLGVSSRRIAEMAAERPSFVVALSSLAGRGIVPAAGGVLIAGRDGAAIGAVGVTGDTSDNDERAALAGLEAAGLQVLA